MVNGGILLDLGCSGNGLVRQRRNLAGEVACMGSDLGCGQLPRSGSRAKALVWSLPHVGLPGSVGLQLVGWVRDGGVSDKQKQNRSRNLQWHSSWLEEENYGTDADRKNGNQKQTHKIKKHSTTPKVFTHFATQSTKISGYVVSSVHHGLERKSISFLPND